MGLLNKHDLMVDDAKCEQKRGVNATESSVEKKKQSVLDSSVVSVLGNLVMAAMQPREK